MPTDDKHCTCGHEFAEHYGGQHNCMRSKCECAAPVLAAKKHKNDDCSCRECEWYNSLGYYR